MPQNQRVLILGAGVMQAPALTLARELGFLVAVVDGNVDAPYRNCADYFEPIDLKDTGALLEFALKLRGESAGLAGVFTAGTDFSASVAFIAEKLGLPGIPYEAALDATDKERMRLRFAAAHVPSPAFLTAGAVPELTFSLPFDYPVVVKPVDNMGARGCRMAADSAALRSACAAALKCSRSSRVIIEEYLDGPEYSADALVFHGEIMFCGLAERHIRYPPYFIEIGHTMPAVLDAKTERCLLDVFAAGIRALGITDGAAKGDIKLTARGPVIGEIAARLSGGYMSGWTYPYASGVQPTRGALRIACGKAPGDLTPRRCWVSAERAFISIPGTVAKVCGLDAARSVEHIKDVFCRVAAGDGVIFPENNVSKCGNVISAAPGRAAAVSAAETAVRRVVIGLAAPCAETERFLAMPLDTPFPPSAFRSGVLYAALDALPLSRAFGQNSLLSVCPFPAFFESDARDYAGRTPAESIDAVRALTGEPLPVEPEGVLGREFWRAMLRGGCQGAAYYIEALLVLSGAAHYS